MENSNFSRNRHGEHLGVNKMGKNIKKSPLHQPNFANAKPQPQPQVYNISKNDFRSIVQQLTGSPSQDPSPRPPNPSKSMRLQKIRPPPLTPIYRPPIHPPAPASFNNSFVRPGPIGQPSVSQMPSVAPGDQVWAANTAESPISAYMRYLQTSMLDSSPRQPQQFQPQLQAPPGHPQAQAYQFQAQAQAQARLQGQGPIHPSSSGILPTPPQPTYQYPGAPAFPSPRGNAGALLPSPTSQFLLPSPSFFSNLLSPTARSPRSSYPLISPTFQYPPPLTPNFAYSPSQSGILGPGPQQPPPSPGIFFPPSPGFFSSPSPRWRDQ